jgi:hypothetical protein
MQLCGLSKARPISCSDSPPSSGSKPHPSRSQKAQTVSLVSCLHHLYNADLHQMVLLRPIECTRLIRHYDEQTPRSKTRLSKRRIISALVSGIRGDGHGDIGMLIVWIRNSRAAKRLSSIPARHRPDTAHREARLDGRNTDPSHPGAGRWFCRPTRSAQSPHLY